MMEMKPLQEELAVICQRIDDHECGRREDPDYDVDLARLRSIGKCLDMLGGYFAMVSAAAQASRHYENVGATVFPHWQGIGEWE